MTSQPTASIVIPTHSRPQYLEVTLASIVPQAEKAGAEVLVVIDPSDLTASSAVATSQRARAIERSPGAGTNAARNAGIEAARGELIVFVDDDVEVLDGWLLEVLKGARGNPDHDVFGGPIRARLEGGGPRSCGREPAPITTLDQGAADRDVEVVWGANMAIRRRALDQVGPFDEAIQGRGEEEEWQQRYAALGGRTRYLAQAGLDHRRTLADSTVRSLARARYAQGRQARRYDLRNGDPPTTMAELRTLLGCCWHLVRRQCANGIVMAAQAAGRLREALAGSSR